MTTQQWLPKNLLQLEIPTIKSSLNSACRASFCHGINVNQFIQMFVFVWLGEYTRLLTSSAMEIKNVSTKGFINLLWTATHLSPPHKIRLSKTSRQTYRWPKLLKSVLIVSERRGRREKGRSSQDEHKVKVEWIEKWKDLEFLWVLLSLEGIQGRQSLPAWGKWHSAC